jgi:hypothetical protein
VLLATRHGPCAAKVSAINQLEALIVAAPEELRAELGGLTGPRARGRIQPNVAGHAPRSPAQLEG